MRTINNIYLTAGEPHARFVKTVPHAITGWRIDPDTGKPITFSLVSSDAPLDYDREVLEIYTEKELLFLKQRNRYLFEQGLIKPFEGTPVDVDMTNVLTDAEIERFATIRLPNKLISELREITSAATVQRIRDAAVDIGRPAKIIEAIDNRLKELA